MVHNAFRVSLERLAMSVASYASCLVIIRCPLSTIIINKRFIEPERSLPKDPFKNKILNLHIISQVDILH